MTDVLAFLDDFKKTRDFKSVLPLLLKDVHLRNGVFEQISTNRYPHAEHASWIAQHFFETYPNLLKPWIDSFKTTIVSLENSSIRRNLLHIFAHIQLSIEDDGVFLNQLLEFIKRTDSPTALKVNAFKTIEKQYFKPYPELILEISLLMDLHREDTRPSIQSLRRNFHKQYSKQLNRLSI